MLLKIFAVVLTCDSVVVSIYPIGLVKGPTVHMGNPYGVSNSTMCTIIMGQGIFVYFYCCLEFGVILSLKDVLHVSQTIINSPPGGDIKVLKYLDCKISHVEYYRWNIFIKVFNHWQFLGEKVQLRACMYLVIFYGYFHCV